MMKWLSNDLGIKIISLLLAIGLWFYAVGEESIEVNRTIPLEIKVENNQVSLLKSSVRYLRVTLAAPRNLLSDLTSKDIKAIHEIKSTVKTAGEYSFRLLPSDIDLPSPQIRVVNIFPETAQVTLDELIVQKVKIKPRLAGDPAFGYKVKEDKIEIDPNTILLEGPKGQLEKLASVLTEKIDLIGRIRSFRQTVGVSLPSNVKALSQATVDIFIPIKEEFGEKQYDAIPLKVMQKPTQRVDVSLDKQEIAVTLKGSQLQLEKLSEEKPLAYLDVTELGAGEHEVDVQMVLPEDVSLKEPVIIRVHISKASDTNEKK